MVAELQFRLIADDFSCGFQPSPASRPGGLIALLQIVLNYFLEARSGSILKSYRRNEIIQLCRILFLMFSKALMLAMLFFRSVFLKTAEGVFLQMNSRVFCHLHNATF